MLMLVAVGVGQGSDDTPVGWTHVGGDAGRSGRADLVGPLDILANLEIYGPPVEAIDIGGQPVVGTGAETDRHFAPRSLPFIVVDGDLFGYWRQHDQGQCFVVRVDLDDPAVVHEPLGPCTEAPHIQAYDPRVGWRLECVGYAARADPVATAIWTANETVRWSVRPEEILAASGAVGVFAAMYTCDGAAIDPWTSDAVLALRPVGGTVPVTPTQFLFVRDPAVDGAGHSVVARIDAEGAVRWAQSWGSRLDTSSVEQSAARPLSVSISPNAILTVGVEETGARGVEWFEHDGSLGGRWTSDFAALSLDPDARRPLPGQWSEGSDWAAMQGDIALFQLWGQTYILDAEAEATPRPLGPPFPNVGIDRGSGGPTWGDGIAYVPMPSGLLAVSTSTGEQAAFRAVTGATVSPVYTETGELWALEADGVVQLHPTTLTLLARYPTLATSTNIPIQYSPETQDMLGDGSGLYPVPERNQLIAWRNDGRWSLLGTADAERLPHVAPDDAFPRKGQAVTLDVTAAMAGVTDVQVSWGDGVFQTAPSERALRHAYIEEGVHEVRLMVAYEDGLTGTAVVEIDVGGSAPTTESWVASQFRTNPDASWGVVGLIVALLGALVAIISARRRRQRLRRELDAIERAAEASSDPAQRTAAMQERRAHVRGLLLDGRIDESQLRVLEDRIDELARGGRIESMRGRFDFLPYGFVQQVQEMLADGRLSGWEYDQLEKLLSADRSLTTAQKKRVRSLLSDWAKEDA